MFEFMDTETDVIDRDDVKLPDDIHPDISFEDVSFSYDSDKGNALKNFTMKVRPDAKVAIVGKSGSGKSTVVNLLMRYFDCQTGQIRIGGREIHDFKIGYLRSLISFVRTEAKRGSADIEIGCVREADVGRVRNRAASSAHIVPDGFLYVPGLQKKRRKKFTHFLKPLC